MESEERHTKKAKITDYMIVNNNTDKSICLNERQDDNAATNTTAGTASVSATDTSGTAEGGSSTTTAVVHTKQTVTNTSTVSTPSSCSDDVIDKVMDQTPTDIVRMPEIFQTETLTMEERWNVIKWDILPDSKPFEVDPSFYYYFKDNAKAGDWQAVWRSHQLMCDILVQVKSLNDMTANVELAVPFCCEAEDGEGAVTQERVADVLMACKSRVALLELYPVFDESGELDNTAMALEHLRFFYDYIWRLSDENDDGDYIYANRDLEQRMKLYYDVKNKKVSAAVVEKYTETMAAYQQKHWRLKLKRAQFDPDSEDEDEDDDGPEIPESDMAEMTELCEDLETLMKTLEKLEDPVMRAILMKGLTAKSAKAQTSSEQRHSRPNHEVITHLVAEKLTVAMIKHLDLDDSTVITHHTSPKSAIETSYNGDTILLFPGRYSGDAFYNLTQSVIIKGVGSLPSDVVITCQENISILVDCTAYRLSISNVMFEEEQNAGASFAALDVRSGTTTLINCVFQSMSQSIVVAKEATLNMDKCQIHGSHASGVRVNGGATFSLTNSHIHHCGSADDTDGASFNSGVGIEVTEGSEDLHQTSLTLTNNKIENNNGPGVWFEIYANNTKGRSKPTNLATDDGASVASLLPPCIKLEAKDNVFLKNGVTGSETDTAFRVQYIKCVANTSEVVDT